MFISYPTISYGIVAHDVAYLTIKWGVVREGSVLERKRGLIRGSAHYDYNSFRMQLVITFSLFTCRKVFLNVILLTGLGKNPGHYGSCDYTKGNGNPYLQLAWSDT